MSPRTNVRWTAAHTALCALSIMLCMTHFAYAEGTLAKIKRTGVFTVGVRYDFAPLGSIDLSGNPVGFAPDLAKVVAALLGVRVKFVQTTAATRVPLLLNGQVDAVFGPITPYKSREETVDFTIPYAWASAIILIRKGEDPNPKDYGPPKKVGATQDSGDIAALKQIVPNAHFVIFQDFTDAFTALQNHKVDAVAVNRAPAVIAQKNDPSVFAVGGTVSRDVWAIMVRQNDSKWRNFLNWTVQELWADGKYQKLYQKWFGDKPWFPMWSQYGLQPGIGGPMSCCR